MTAATTNSEKKVTKPNLAYQRDKAKELVTGMFKYYELPGGSVSFVFKEYKGDPVERYDLVDGQIYKLPLGVAKHLNKRGWYPVHAYSVDENGRPAQKIGQKVRRFGFQSLEFVDIEDLTEEGSGLITVEKV